MMMRQLRPDRAASFRSAQKLFEINWGLVTLLVVIAGVGIAMLYSVVGGSWQPYALAQLIRFSIAILILIVVSLVDIRIWMRLAYPAYAIGLLLSIGVEIIGDDRQGRNTLDHARAANAATFRDHEDLAGAGACALSAMRAQVRRSTIPFTLVPALLLILVPAALVMHQPDLGTAMLLLLCGAGMLFLGGLSWWYIAQRDHGCDLRHSARLARLEGLPERPRA